MSITLPSGRVTRMKLPPWPPFFTGWMVTLTLSPRCRVFFDQPRRSRKLGLMPSTPHCSAPLAAGTSSQIQLCGLVHWKSVTVPEMVFSWAMSNMAKEWWARAGDAEARAAAAKSTSPRWREDGMFMRKAP